MTVSARSSGPHVGVNPVLLLFAESSADGTSTALSRDGGYGQSASSRHLLLAAGKYTVEVTTSAGEATGGYELTVARWAADACLRDWGALSAAAPSVSASGIVAVDASCTSAPGELVFGPAPYLDVRYARRHTFTLDAAATVSVGAAIRDPRWSRIRLLLLMGSSADGSGGVLASADPDREGLTTLEHELQAGTYTVEVTSLFAGATGGYGVWVRRWPSDGCLRDLGSLDATALAVRISGRTGRDASCVSPQREPLSAAPFYARRHSFRLAEASTVSVSAFGLGDGSPGMRVVLLAGTSADGRGRVVFRSAPADGNGVPPRGYVALAEGTYTAEVTAEGAAQTGGYELWVRRSAPDECVRDLGTLGDTTTSASAAGIVAANSSCVSSRHGPAGSVASYARRHTFMLREEFLVSVFASSRDEGRPAMRVALVDSEGSVVARADGADASFGAARLDYRRLAAGSYTVEVSFADAGRTGGYRVTLTAREARPCLHDLGTLDGASRFVSVSGFVWADASCVSTQRDPASASTFYARRHRFTLDAASTVSLGASPGEVSLILLKGLSADGRGEVLHRADSSTQPSTWLSHVSLDAGTYTVEVTYGDAGDTGSYQVWVSRVWTNGRQATTCTTDLGVLDAAHPYVTAQDAITANASCVSQSYSSPGATYYARRYSFTLKTEALISLSANRPGFSSEYRNVALIKESSHDGSSAALASSSRELHAVLPPGTFTAEVSSANVQQPVSYSVAVRRSPVEACLRDHGTLARPTGKSNSSDIMALDASCVAPQRGEDPDDTASTRYARRHAFTLERKAAVLIWWRQGYDGNYPVEEAVLLEGLSPDGSGTVLARAAEGLALPGISRTLPAGTYTVEFVGSGRDEYRGDVTGSYDLSLRSWEVEGCVHQMGTLPAEFTRSTIYGILPVDPSCVTQRRDAPAEAVFYSRRHAFTLQQAAAVSLSADGHLYWRGVGSPENGINMVLRRESGSGQAGTVIASRLSYGIYGVHAEVDPVLLNPGDYSIEIASGLPEDRGSYELTVVRVPAQRLITVSDATARENDDEAVLTVSVDPIGDVPFDDEPVRVEWTVVPGSANLGSDYRHAGGTIWIPAGSRHATLTVPLVDDTDSESAETFSVRVQRHQGAVRAADPAEATIVDDDPAPSTPAPSASTCADAQVTGSVDDVFDVAQRQYRQWADVFVDIELFCEGGSAGSGGYRTGVEVLRGSAAPRASKWCVRGGESPVTESLTAAGGCAATVIDTGLLSTRAEATHIVRIPDSAVGQAHQLLVWADLDGDGVFDRGEPHDFVTSDFGSRTSTPATPTTPAGQPDFRLGEGFEARVLDRGVISRAGQWTSVRVGLGEVVEAGYESPQVVVPARTRPLANAPVAAFVSVGPSSTARVHCVTPSVPHAPSSGRAGACVTDGRGQVTFRWQAPADAAHALRRGRDTIRVFVDRDRDGVYDPDPLDILSASAGAEPSATFDVDVAKAVNYVALGDSYSSGEQGRSAAVGFVGSYRGEDIDPALGNPNAAKCRRWSEAYPEVFTRRVLGNPDYGIAVTFDTFACTGALTENVHEPTDPEGLSVLERHNVTNRPSPHTSIRDIELDSEGEVTSITIPTHWEPRQAVSLANARQRLQAQGRDIDMVTITIGGNDVDFASIVRGCGTFGCGGELSVVLADVQDRVTSTLRQIRAAVPEAAVFVLGYSPLTPQPTACPPGVESCPELGLNGFIDQCRALSSAEVLAQSADRGLISDIPIVGFGPFRLSANNIAAVTALAFSGSLKIDHVEAQYLWDGATRLNAAVQDAASAAGVHYVDTTGGVPLAESPRGFVGHDPCSEDPWLHGFVVDRAEFPIARSGKSFHPAQEGHDGYARLLEQNIRGHYAAGADLTDAGLPVNPEPQP